MAPTIQLGKKKPKSSLSLVGGNVRKSAQENKPTIQLGGEPKKKEKTSIEKFQEQKKVGEKVSEFGLSVIGGGAGKAAKTLAKTATSKRKAFIELAEAFPKLIKQTETNSKEAIKGATAIITRTKTLLKSAIRGSKKGGIERLPKGTSITTQRAFVGKDGKSGVEKLFNFNIKDLAKRYPTNKKSIGQSALSLAKRGLSGAAVAIVVGAFSTYPFAAWAEQEVLSSLKISARDARERGDFETAEEMIALREEILENPWWKDLPYENVIRKFESFFEADKLSIESEKRLITQARGQIEFEGKSVGEEIKERDIKIKEEQETRDLKFKTAEEERKERQDKRDEEFETAEKERTEKQDKRDAEFKANQERRDKEFEERAKAEDAKFAKLREEQETRDLETTKFFEAIRKRNAGEKLTAEEIRILEERGASSKSTTKQRKSRVQF